MKSTFLRLGVLGAFALAAGGSYMGQAAEPTAKELAAFGTLRAPTLEAARAQAQDWLKTTSNMDQKAFDAIWVQADRPMLDMVAETLALGNPDAKKLLAEANDPNEAAPKTVPSLIKDTKLPAFFRANLALAYAKSLANRKVYEEAHDALKTVKPEQVVDPAAYFFHRAVTEHGMLLKTEATRTIARLLDDVPDSPERYKMVAALMFLDMQNWKDKDLADISRKMNNIERRLELARGGPQTQKMQKEVVARLDELIKKLENQSKQQQQGQPGNGGQCPEGGAPGNQPGSGNQPGNSNQPSSPQTDSFGGQNSGPGQVDPRKLKEMVETWGKLPEKERVKVMNEMIRGMPPSYRQMIEDYYKQTTRSEGGAGR